MQVKKITLKKEVVAKISNNEMAGLFGRGDTITDQICTTRIYCPTPLPTPEIRETIFCCHTCGTEWICNG